MEVSAWKNGAFGAQGLRFGIRVGPVNRAKHFNRDWPTVSVELQNGPTVEIPIAEGFWCHCPELRHDAISEWLQVRGLVPWPDRHPPKLALNPLGGRRFRLSK